MCPFHIKCQELIFREKRKQKKKKERKRKLLKKKKKIITVYVFMPKGLDNIQFGWDREVNQFLIHNASLTLCVLSTSKSTRIRYSTE